MLIYLLLIFLIITISILALHLRLKVNLDQSIKTAFIGLGRSGLSFDLSTKKLSLTLFNRQIKELKIKDKKPKVKKVKKKKELVKKPYIDYIKILPKIIPALTKYSISIMKNLIFEEIKGEIDGGFDSPDLTGQAYGFYCTLAGAIPAVGNHLIYRPVWTEAALSGSFRASVSIPLYKLIGRTLVFILNLPLREIIKLSKNK